MSYFGGFIFKNITSFGDSPAISITDSSASSYTMSSGNSYALLQNVGDSIAWFGSSDVNPATGVGNYLVPGERLILEHAQAGVEVYFKCASGDTTTIGVVEA